MPVAVAVLVVVMLKASFSRNSSTLVANRLDCFPARYNGDETADADADNGDKGEEEWDVATVVVGDEWRLRGPAGAAPPVWLMSSFNCCRYTSAVTARVGGVVETETTGRGVTGTIVGPLFPARPGFGGGSRANPADDEDNKAHLSAWWSFRTGSGESRRAEATPMGSCEEKNPSTSKYRTIISARTKKKTPPPASPYWLVCPAKKMTRQDKTDTWERWNFPRDLVLVQSCYNILTCYPPPPRCTIRLIITRVLSEIKCRLVQSKSGPDSFVFRPLPKK